MKLITYIALPVLIWSLILMSLTACAQTKTRIVTKEIRVPVSTPCVGAVPAAGEYAADKVELEASIFELVQALLVEREQRKARELELRAVVEGCR